MPKARGSGNIGSIGEAGGGASGGGLHSGGRTGTSAGATSGAVGDQIELAGRLLDRLRDIGPVDVPVNSTTRGRMENVRVTFDTGNQGMANVESESGTTHRVDYNNDRCSCPHHRTRGTRCRHIEAAHRAIGRILAQRPEPDIETGQAAGTVQVETAVNERMQADRRDEDERNDIQRIEEDDGIFYTENEEEFQRAMQRAMTEQPEYEYNNVLNGSSNTFGLEIEFVGGNPNAIARELYELGICAYDQQVAYHSRSVEGLWKLERDGSVSDGGELVSPVLTDTPETWRTIEKICEVANRHNARVDHRCGGHVHMGIDPLDTAKQRWKRFFKTIGGFEDVMYRLSGGSLGRIRSGYTRYATPFSERARYGERANFAMNEMSDVHSLARNVSEGNRYYGINLTNIYNDSRPNTVEFRSYAHKSIMCRVA